jgi:hypothetical protein
MPTKGMAKSSERVQKTTESAAGYVDVLSGSADLSLTLLRI